MAARSQFANRLRTREIQNGGQIELILKIVDIFVDIFHSYRLYGYCFLIESMILSLKLISRIL